MAFCVWIVTARVITRRGEGKWRKQWSDEQNSLTWESEPIGLLRQANVNNKIYHKFERPVGLTTSALKFQSQVASPILCLDQASW